MTRTVEKNPSLIVENRRHSLHFISKLCLCKNYIKLNSALIARFDALKKAACFGRKLIENLVDLLLLLALKNLDFVVGFNNAGRLNENRGSA